MDFSKRELRPVVLTNVPATQPLVSFKRARRDRFQMDPDGETSLTTRALQCLVLCTTVSCPTNATNEHNLHHNSH